VRDESTSKTSVRVPSRAQFLHRYRLAAQMAADIALRSTTPVRVFDMDIGPCPDCTPCRPVPAPFQRGKNSERSALSRGEASAIRSVAYTTEGVRPGSARRHTDLTT